MLALIKLIVALLYYLQAFVEKNCSYCKESRELNEKSCVSTLSISVADFFLALSNNMLYLG